MKKKFTLIIALLSIICCTALAFIGCDGSGSNVDVSPIIDGIDGCKNVVIDPDAKTITAEVDSLTDTLALSKFRVPKGVTVKAYYDEAKTQVVEEEVSLDFGDNVFYAEASVKITSVTYKVTIKREKPSSGVDVTEMTMPNYSPVSPAELDAKVFADTVSKWYAMFCTYGSTTEEFKDEEFDYHMARAKNEYYDIFYSMAQRFAKSGFSTELIQEMDKYLYPIFEDLQQMSFEIDGIDCGSEAESVYKTVQIILDKERLTHMRDNAKALIHSVKPEYLSAFITTGLDGMIKDFDSDMLGFGNAVAAAEKAGLTEVAAYFKEKKEQWDEGISLGKFVDYNTGAFLAEELVGILDVILDGDIDALSSAALCITDIITMGTDKIGDLVSGNGKYSYRQIITHANTIGNLLTSLIDSIEYKPIVIAVAKDLTSKILTFVQMDGYFSTETLVDAFGNLDLYKSLGILLRDLTVEDITDIYMDYNDWQVAVNNEKPDKEQDAKFAILVARAAKLIGTALGDADVESAVNSACSIAKTLGYTVYNPSALTTVIVKAKGIEDPMKMTEQQSSEISELIHSCLTPSKSYESIEWWADTSLIKSGTTQAEFVEILSEASEFIKFYYDEESEDLADEQLDVKDAIITGFDSTGNGYKTATLTWDNLVAKVNYYVYSSDTKNQMEFDWISSHNRNSLKCYQKGQEVTLEDVLEYYDHGYYSYFDADSMFSIEVKMRECDDLRLVGMDTSEIGQNTGYIVGEHEIMGTQMFSFDYYVVGSEKVYYKYELRSNEYRYQVGDKFSGSFETHYRYYDSISDRIINSSDSITLDEDNLSYDFSTVGEKTVTYTYEGKQYTCVVYVFSKEYAKEITYFNVYSYNCGYIKSSSQEMIFEGRIEFKSISYIDFDRMTVNDVRKALKEVSAEYDIVVKGFDTNQAVGEYTAVVTITKSGKVVKKDFYYYRIVDTIDSDSIFFISITVADYKSANATAVEDLNVEYITINSYGWSDIYVKDLEELSDYGELSYRSYDVYWGEWIFTLPNGNVKRVSINVKS